MDIGKLKPSYDWQVPKQYSSRTVQLPAIRDAQIRALLGQDQNFSKLRSSMRKSYLMEVLLTYDNVRVLFYNIPGERLHTKVRGYSLPETAYSADYYRVQIDGGLEQASDSEISFVRESYPVLYLERNLKPSEVNLLNELEVTRKESVTKLTGIQDAEIAAVELLQAISEANEIAVPTLEG